MSFSDPVSLVLTINSLGVNNQSSLQFFEDKFTVLIVFDLKILKRGRKDLSLKIGMGPLKKYF